MDAEKLIESSAKLAEALKNNPAADGFIELLTLVITCVFVYFLISMLIAKFKTTRADRVLGSIEQTLRENVSALDKVTTTLERLKD